MMPKKLGIGVCVVLLLLAGCGGGGGGNEVAPPPPFSVTITPASSTLEVGDTLQFSSEVNRSDFAVTWHVNDIEGGNTTVGTIAAGGLYTAPATAPNPAAVAVKAVPHADTTKSATAQLTVTSKLSVSPSAAVVPTGHTQQFTSNKSATWSVNDVAGGNATVGTVSSAGLYTAPANVPSPETVTVKAAWQVNPAKTVTATVTVTPASSVSISPTIVTVAAGATQQFTANTAVNWELSGATGNTQPLGAMDSSGLYTAPLAPPLNATVKVTAVSQDDPAQQAVAFVTITFSSASLQGHYAFRFRGATAVSRYYLVGSFVADGQGGVSDAVFDFQDLSSPIAGTASAVNYAVAPDGRGALIIVYGTNQIATRFVMTSSDSARVIAFGAGISGSGSIDRQDPASFPAGLSGRFAFAFDGTTAGNNPLAAAGMFTAGGAGNLTSGLQDINDNGTAAGSVVFTGTYTPVNATTGRGQLSMTANSETTNYVYYMLSADTFIFSSLSVDCGAIGLASRQEPASYSNASLSGNSVYEWSGGMPENTPTQHLAVGRFTSNGNGTISSGVADVDAVGTGVEVPFTGTYSIASNGQGHASLVRTGASDNLTLYMFAGGSAFFVTRDRFLAASGQIRPQGGVPFSTSSLNGSFGFSTRSTRLDSSVDLSGQLTFDGNSGTLSGVLDINQGATQLEAISVSGTFTISSNGRGVASLNVAGSSSTLGIYMLDSGTLLLIENDPAVPSKFGPALKQF